MFIRRKNVLPQYKAMWGYSIANMLAGLFNATIALEVFLIDDRVSYFSSFIAIASFSLGLYFMWQAKRKTQEAMWSTLSNGN